MSDNFNNYFLIPNDEELIEFLEKEETENNDNLNRINKFQTNVDCCVKRERFPLNEINAWWIYARNDFYSNEDWNPNLSGKWIVFLKGEDEINKGWKIICANTRNDQLGPSSKVSTKFAEITNEKKGRNIRINERVVCVYTKNYENEEDLRRVRDKLRKLGFTKPLCYKTDNATRTIGSFSGHKGHLICKID